MLNLKVALVSVMLIIGVSCSHGTHSHGSHDSSAELTLNNGKKWVSDKHTMNSINNMKKIVYSSQKSGDTSLKKKLEAELDVLIGGCTMEGEHHDALHIYLEELMPLVDNLGSKDMASVKETEKKIESLLKKYPNYFELN